MHLLAALAGGLSSAASGTARIYQRGTSTRATYYTDFEGYSVVSSGPDVVLDANGAAVIYVNQLVDVSVYTAAGVLVETFNAGAAASSIEVRSASFSGTDYRTGGVAAGNPQGLDTVLDLWKTSANNTDFNVDFQGSTLSLRAAFWRGRAVINVKNPIYGAVGDGVTDDYAAILTAVTAAGNTGVVFFPVGSYLINTTLNINKPITLLGISIGVEEGTASGEQSSILGKITNTGIGVGGVTLSAVGMVFENRSGVTETPITLTGTGGTFFENCKFILSFTSGVGYAVSVGSVAGKVNFRNCYFSIGPTGQGIRTTTGATRIRVRVQACRFTLDGDLHIGTAISGAGIAVDGCFFDFGLSCSGAVYINPGSNALDGAWFGSATNNIFTGSSSLLTPIGNSLDAPGAAAVYLESGNLFLNNGGLFSSGINEPIQLFAPGAATPGLQFRSRNTMQKQDSFVANTYEINTYSFGSAYLRKTGGAATLTVSAAVGLFMVGWSLDVIVDNATGASLTVTFNAAQFIGAFTAVIANTSRRTLRFVATNLNGTYRWIQVGADAGNL